jgi:hypothetical protein
VRDLVELAFATAGLDWRRHVEVDRFFRPTEVDALLGDPTKARDILSWQLRVSPNKGGIQSNACGPLAAQQVHLRAQCGPQTVGGNPIGGRCLIFSNGYSSINP